MRRDDVAKLKAIEARNRDLYNTSGDVIAANGFLRLSACVVAETKWLCEKLRAACGLKRGQEVADEDADDAGEEATEPETAGAGKKA